MQTSRIVDVRFAPLPRLSSDPDRVKADRVRQAMYGMHKIIIADLEAAYVGKV